MKNKLLVSLIAPFVHQTVTAYQAIKFTANVCFKYCIHKPFSSR